MKQVAIVIMDKSVGNESVGEMWKETKVFNLEDPISKIFKWADISDNEHSKRNIVITKSIIEED